MVSIKQSKFVIAASGLVALLSGQVVRAESPCSGLVVDRCASQGGCLWVKGYTRKDGKAVKGYCRSKGGAGAEGIDKSDLKASASERDKTSSRVNAAAMKPKQGS